MRALERADRVRSGADHARRVRLEPRCGSGDLSNAGLGVQVHLKLVKMGGCTDLMAAAALLHEHGIKFMIGQMNEGGAATAAAVHCVMAARPHFAELYGADGLIDDPVSGVHYRDGRVEIPNAPGLGVSLDPDRCTLLWETFV